MKRYHHIVTLVTQTILLDLLNFIHPKLVHWDFVHKAKAPFTHLKFNFIHNVQNTV